MKAIVKDHGFDVEIVLEPETLKEESTLARATLQAKKAAPKVRYDFGGALMNPYMSIILAKNARAEDFLRGGDKK